jgi:hypothetical protein
MTRKLVLFLTFLVLANGLVMSQAYISTSELFHRPENNSHTGQLNIIQDPSIDTLISRYVLANKYTYDEIGYYGMDGFRIQIYSSSNRNAREESGKVRAAFMSRFPDIVSYPLYAEPGYFKIRVGDFRTRAEATKLFLTISRDFPDSYIVPDKITFPDQNLK